MVSVINNTYKLSNTSDENLKKLGFRYDRNTSDTATTNYIYRFSVYKYEGKSLLDCELLVNIDTKIVSVNVYQQNGKIYPSFYCTEFNGNDSLIKEINNKILNEFKKLHIKQSKNKKSKDGE